MKRPWNLALALGSAIAASTLLMGCGSASPGCQQVPFISPSTAMLDHTSAGNAQQFTTGYRNIGSGTCSVPAVEPGYVWTVSDTTDASASGIGFKGTVSCTNAAVNPITISTILMGSVGNGPITVLPSGLPSATLICK